MAGAVVMIVGTVIGAGIYIMIGPLAVATGPGVFLCYLLALVPALVSSICYAQVASVFPATAATYQYARLFFSDFAGFLFGWLRWISSFYGLALMGLGFADYFAAYHIVDGRLIAALVVTTFYLVNILGIKTTSRVQSVLVVAVLAGLMLFSGLGIFKVSPGNLFPMAGAGFGAILKGCIIAFYAYTGLYIVAEIGDEIHNPQKNIPLSIFIAAVLISLVYLAAALTFAGGLGWPAIKQYRPNLAQAAKMLLSPKIAAFIQFSAIVAIITPINAIYIGSSRVLYSMAQDGMMPKIFAKLNRFGAPWAALTVIYLVGLVMVLVNLPILFLGTISSVVILAGMVLVAGACLKLKGRYPDEFENAPFKLSAAMLVLLPVSSIAMSLMLMAAAFIQDHRILYSMALWTAAGCVYYSLRVRPALRRKNFHAGRNEAEF